MKKLFIILFILISTTLFSQVQSGDQSIGLQGLLMKSSDMSTGNIIFNYGVAISDNVEINFYLPFSVMTLPTNIYGNKEYSRYIPGTGTVHYALYEPISQENKVHLGFGLNTSLNIYLTTKTKAVPYILIGGGAYVPDLNLAASHIKPDPVYVPYIGVIPPAKPDYAIETLDISYFGGLGLRYFINRNFSWKIEATFGGNSSISLIDNPSSTRFNITSKTGLVYTF